MTRVYLMSTLEPRVNDDHWASPYFAIRQAFLKYQGRLCSLVDSPDDADVVLICPRLRNPVFPVEILQREMAWRLRHKCVVLSTDDAPTRTHKGFYTSASAATAVNPLVSGGFYPLVAFGHIPEGLPLLDEPKYLFSFVGSFQTHPVRALIGHKYVDECTNRPASIWAQRGFVEDRRSSLVETEQQLRLYKDQYVRCIRETKFVLCPRGMCPTSVRLFESMKAGRVPVVISDDWLPPPEIPWKDFIVRVPERDVTALDSILTSEESSFAARSMASLTAWREYFAEDVLPETVSRWSMSIIEASQNSDLKRKHIFRLLTQLVGWRFFRRGLIPELRRGLGLM